MAEETERWGGGMAEGTGRWEWRCDGETESRVDDDGRRRCMSKVGMVRSKSEWLSDDIGNGCCKVKKLEVE